MILNRLVPAFLFSIALLAHCQEAAPPADGNQKEKPEKSVGNYYVSITTLEPSAATHLLNPAVVIPVDAATKMEPKDANGTLSIPPQYSIESVGHPRYLCVPGSARDHGCEAIDRCTLTVRDPNTLEYHVINHGATVQLKVNLLVHDITPVSHPGERSEWHPHDVIFVSVPASTASNRVVSTVLVGEWNHEAVVFNVGKPLTGAAKRALDDLGVRENLGDKVLYSYRVREPLKSVKAK